MTRGLVGNSSDLSREEVPVTVSDPESSVSESIHELARVITGESELPYEPYEEGEIDRTVQRLSRGLSWKRS